MDTSNYGLLSPAAYGILLALSLKPRHGYEIQQQIVQDTAGHLTLGAGALYGTIKILRNRGFIEDVPSRSNDRRRYYRLTKKAWDRLMNQSQYYERMVLLARERRILDNESIY